MTHTSRARVPGVVVTYPNRTREPEHETVVHRELARRLAALQGLSYAGDYDPARPVEGLRYFVPSGTIVGLEEARRLGLHGEADLFGGVVPAPFIETKAITHPLVRPDALAPPGWSPEFGAQVQGSVLHGYTAFCLDDARAAAHRLLADGPVRLKPVLATAGRGQQRVEARAELEQALATVDTADMARCGLVIEAHLEEVTTISVGQVRVGRQVVSYHGTQRLTQDNQGHAVYGGSDLVVVPGGFDRLLALDLPDALRLAVDQARVYDQAAARCYPRFFASRRNYDIAQGRGARGERLSGVLEQSWRIGGASSAEVAALEVFAQEPGRTLVRASSHEVYGPQPAPRGATLLFEGQDAEVGHIAKYVMVEHYGREL